MSKKKTVERPRNMGERRQWREWCARLSDMNASREPGSPPVRLSHAARVIGCTTAALKNAVEWSKADPEPFIGSLSSLAVEELEQIEKLQLAVNFGTVKTARLFKEDKVSSAKFTQMMSKLSQSTLDLAARKREIIARSRASELHLREPLPGETMMACAKVNYENGFADEASLLAAGFSVKEAAKVMDSEEWKKHVAITNANVFGEVIRARREAGDARLLEYFAPQNEDADNVPAPTDWSAQPKIGES